MNESPMRTLEHGTHLIRPARVEDSRFLWILSMDPSVRAMSTRQQWYPFQEHDRWLREKLANGRNCIWIMEVEGMPVAQVRYGRAELYWADVSEGNLHKTIEAEIAIAVSPSHRGKGYARDLLLTTEPWARQDLHVSTLVALVLEHNTASAALFESCGYRRVGSEERMGRSHHRYQKR